jgi:hypothetical protein
MTRLASSTATASLAGFFLYKLFQVWIGKTDETPLQTTNRSIA